MKNKSVIITGASKGIGRDLSLHFAKLGYNLLLISRDEKLLDSLYSQIKSFANQQFISILASDVLDQEKIADNISKFHAKTSSIDVLINNAGYVKRGTSDLDHMELTQMVNTNLIGAVNMVRIVSPIMTKQSNGYIINMCSRNAKTPRAFLGGYAATKAALAGYSDSLYKELKNTGVKVTSLFPGFVDTQMTAEVNAKRSDLIPTDDICKLLDFLLSMSSSSSIKELSLESKIQIGEFF